MAQLLRHEKRHQNNVIKFFHFEPLPTKVSDYVSDNNVNRFVAVTFSWLPVVGVVVVYS